MQAAAGPASSGGNNSQSKHPNGKKRIRVRDVIAVYGNVEEIPTSAYRDAGVNMRRGRDTLVTASEVKAASDAWDAIGILRDIDTQWGLIPGGGAYSDSNFYYGPGEDDYY